MPVYWRGKLVTGGRPVGPLTLSSTALDVPWRPDLGPVKLLAPLGETLEQHLGEDVLRLAEVTEVTATPRPTPAPTSEANRVSIEASATPTPTSAANRVKYDLLIEEEALMWYWRDKEGEARMFFASKITPDLDMWDHDSVRMEMMAGMIRELEQTLVALREVRERRAMAGNDLS